MAKLMIFILLVASLSLIHAESDIGSVAAALSSSSSRDQVKRERGAEFLLGNIDAHTIDRAKRDFATRRQYDDDNGEPTRYDIVIQHSASNGDATDSGTDGAPTRRRMPADIRNLARLLHGMPQFNSFYAKYQPEKRAVDLRQSAPDKDDSREISGMSSMLARLYGGGEPLGRGAERLVQQLRDQLQATNSPTYSRVTSDDKNNRPEVYGAGLGTIGLGNAEEPLYENRDKRRRCHSDPNLGIKNPSSCDTDSYFGAADYTMRNVWDSAGRR